MALALKDGGVDPERVNYINAHPQQSEGEAAEGEMVSSADAAPAGGLDTSLGYNVRVACLIGNNPGATETFTATASKSHPPITSSGGT